MGLESRASGCRVYVVLFCVFVCFFAWGRGGRGGGVGWSLCFRALLSLVIAIMSWNEVA